MIFSNLLDLDPDDSSVALLLAPLIPIVKSKNVSRHCQMSPGGKNLPLKIAVWVNKIHYL